MRPNLVPGLSALALLLLAGCTAPQLTHRLLDAPKLGGQINLFGQAGGTGALSIRIVDQRPRKVQSFADADAFNAVFFRLSNSVKLKTSLQVATGSQGAGSPTYTAVFPAIPADPSPNYTLSVGLFRNISPGGLANPNDPSYSNLLNKVGEGASTSISVNPGESKNITITINAVGDFQIDSPTININPASPVLMSGDLAIVDTRVNQSNNPGTDRVSVYLTDLGDALVPGASASFNNLASPSTVVCGGLPLPYTPSTSNYKLVVENSRNTASGSYLLSRRSRLVTIEATASIGNITLQ
ncbi:MAG TPA: hypothetical protein V6D05_08710 [Stenomitos sp.]